MPGIFGNRRLVGGDTEAVLRYRAVIEWLEGGGSLDELRDQLATVGALREEQRASLWLYGWRHQHKLLRAAATAPSEDAERDGYPVGSAGRGV